MPPTVTILIPTRDGWPHLEQCLPSLQRLSYPKERLEVLLIDNASSDGTAEKVGRLFPEVRLRRHEENLGFAPALSRTAKETASDYLAFANNDTRVEADWLSRLVEALESEESRRWKAVAACGAILDWSGTAVQFFGGHINFVGKAFHERPSLEAVAASPEVQPIFYPCGAAMLIDRRGFLEAGGFDEDYFMIYEDVDLGWRLNLMGQGTVLVRDARVYHREGASLAGLDYARKALWWERNALWTIFKNYSEPFLRRIWPAALALAFQRERLLLEAGRQGEFEAHHRGVLAGIRSLDRLQSKRAWVQERRRVRDEELLRFFPEPFRLWAYGEPHYELFRKGGYERFRDDCLERFGIRPLFDSKGE